MVWDQDKEATKDNYASQTIVLDQILHELDTLNIEQKNNQRFRVDVSAEALPALLSLLKGRAGYTQLSAISCVDWEDEFELVYHLWSYETKVLVSAHIRIQYTPAVYVSVYDIYTPAGFFERDIYEMYGVYFEGSPMMEKFILTEWHGPAPMLKSFDTLKYVNDMFNWQEYQPDWLKEIQAKGGKVVS